MGVIMTFSERMTNLLDQGKTASMGLAAKAGAKAQDLGERGVLAVEIKQLENKAQKLLGHLGAEVYHAFTEKGEETLTRDSAAVKTILSEITEIRDSIAQKEAEIKQRKKNQKEEKETKETEAKPGKKK